MKQAVFRAPPQLSPGDSIGVFAPAGPFEAALTWRALGFLSKRYRVKFERSMFRRTGYLAVSDERRRDELSSLLSDASVRAIFAARGGYGSHRILADVDWEAFARSPKWIVGFSDITALHVEAARMRIASLHACHVTALGRSEAVTRDALIQSLEHPQAPRAWNNLKVIHPGAAQGVLFGGNLTMLHASAAAQRLHVPDGSILLLEDVTERPYRVDRMLTTLELGGYFHGVRGVVLGDFTDCNPGPDGVTIEEVLHERLQRLGVPVVSGAPFGHALRNEPFVIGAPARLDARAAEGQLAWSGSASTKTDSCVP